MEGKHFICRKS